MAFLLILIVLPLSSCYTVTIQTGEGVQERTDNRPLSQEPDFVKSLHFYLFDLVPKREIQLGPICGKRKVVQLQTQKTFTDSFLGALTSGIYTPKTARVWCGRETS